MAQTLQLPSRLLLGGLLLGALAGCSEPAAPAAGATPAAAAPKAEAPTATAKVTLPVDGMVCEGCESSIREAVTKLEGVASCTASHKEKVATIEYDPAQVKPEQLSEVIAKLGYKVGAPAN